MFHKFKKGSPEAKAFMAKLRAMQGKKRKKNPLTVREFINVQKRHTLVKAAQYRQVPGSPSEKYFTGVADGMEEIARDFGPKLRPPGAKHCSLCGASGRKAGLRGTREGTLCLRCDRGRRAVAADRRGKNPPLLILGNPGSKSKLRPPQGMAMLNDRCLECGRQRATHFPGGPCASVRFERAYAGMPRKSNPGRRRKFKRAAPSHNSAGECPKGFPMKLWRDPAFQRELKVFRSRHGANVPIHVTKVNMPEGSPKFMTAYGRAAHAVYDAPKGRKNGRKFIHHFGKKGKRKPWLVSSASKGPKWLGYAGGTFTAKTNWLYD